MSTEYGKTENLLARDPDTNRLIPGELRSESFGQISKWLVTEKIDGTNVRIILDWGYDADDPEAPPMPVVYVRGRSDNATLPKNLLPEALGVTEAWELSTRMVEAACAICKVTAAELYADPVTVVAYGEAYGPGIQKGGAYAPKKQIRLFDVITFKGEGRVRGLWRTFEDVELMADALGISTVVPLLRDAPTDAVVDFIQAIADGEVPSYSETAAQDGGEATGAPFEGVVARTDPYLFDYRGHRVFFKLKVHDLRP